MICRQSTLLVLFLCSILAVASACSEKKAEVQPMPDTVDDQVEDTDTDEDVVEDTGDDMDIIPDGPKTSTRNQLLWKRASALASDLSRALELSNDLVCKELGQFNCAGVHVIALGGNEPFGLGLYEPVADPMVTTPAAIDRMVLASCANRVDQDLAGDPVVFTNIDLTAASLEADSPEVEAEIVNLYRRFHARNPQPEELELASTLVVDDNGNPVNAADFAKMACFAIGGTTEFVFH